MSLIYRYVTTLESPLLHCCKNVIFRLINQSKHQLLASGNAEKLVRIFFFYIPVLDFSNRGIAMQKNFKLDYEAVYDMLKQVYTT